MSDHVNTCGYLRSIDIIIFRLSLPSITVSHGFYQAVLVGIFQRWGRLITGGVHLSGLLANSCLFHSLCSWRNQGIFKMKKKWFPSLWWQVGVTSREWPVYISDDIHLEKTLEIVHGLSQKWDYFISVWMDPTSYKATRPTFSGPALRDDLVKLKRFYWPNSFCMLTKTSFW